MEYTPKANELVQFLEGRWLNRSFEIVPGTPVKLDTYEEIMLIKSPDTLSITAYGTKDGEVNKDMTIKLIDNHVVLTQGPFTAQGTFTGGVYYLKGIQGDAEYHFRLYSLDDKFVFHREIWHQGKIQQLDMSYLQRM